MQVERAEISSLLNYLSSEGRAATGLRRRPAAEFLAQLVPALAPKAKEPEILAQAVRESAGVIALKSKTNPIGVAEYRLQSQLPAALRGKLPTAKQLTAVVREILPARSG